MFKLDLKKIIEKIAYNKQLDKTIIYKSKLHDNNLKNELNRTNMFHRDDESWPVGCYIESQKSKQLKKNGA